MSKIDGKKMKVIPAGKDQGQGQVRGGFAWCKDMSSVWKGLFDPGCFGMALFSMRGDGGVD